MIEEPPNVANWNDLDDVRNNPGEDFVLASDLDQQTTGYGDVVDLRELVSIRYTTSTARSTVTVT